MSLLFRPSENRSGPTAQQVLNAALDFRGGDDPVLSSGTTDGLRVAAVVACVGLRAGVFAQLPLKAYRDVDGYARALDPQPELLRMPSDVSVPSVWKTQMSVSRDLWGFALGRVVAWDGAFYPKRVEWIDPHCITYEVRSQRVEWRVDGQPVDSSMLVHVPSRFVLPGNPVGMSPLEHSGLVDLARRAQTFGRDWFRFGAVPSAVLRSDEVINQEQADALLDRIMARWRRRQPAVIGKGLEYQQVSVAANESQFLETARQVTADIALSFNLPPEKVGAAIAGSSITYANREQNQQQYLVDSINPDLVVIQESLDRHSPSDQFCKFNTGAFLRSDLQTRYSSYEVGIRSGFLTPNEARALEEMEPMPGGDVSQSSARQLSIAEVVQKVYLGVGKVITSDEAREIVNAMGGQLSVPGPSFNDGEGIDG